jgi:hypothetical protein
VVAHFSLTKRFKVHASSREGPFSNSNRRTLFHRTDGRWPLCGPSQEIGSSKRGPRYAGGRDSKLDKGWDTGQHPAVEAEINTSGSCLARMSIALVVAALETKPATNPANAVRSAVRQYASLFGVPT